MWYKRRASRGAVPPFMLENLRLVENDQPLYRRLADAIADRIERGELSPGDRLPPPSEPQWLIRGIISTGLERVCLLEGKDEQIHARVGDKLADGSVVESISNRGVTFLRSGRRYVKEIGG